MPEYVGRLEPTWTNKHLRLPVSETDVGIARGSWQSLKHLGDS